MTRTFAALVCACLLVVSAAGLNGQAEDPAPPWEQGLSLVEAEDINPDPAIVEINLTAKIAEVEVAPGRRVQAWTYNGVLPGPLVRAQKGNRLIVHFKNELPKPTTVHWHGLQVPIQMDGVPGASQPNVEPGGSFTYDFTVPDAALFWYHPHVMSAAQLGFGLYGPMLVEDPDDGVGLDTERILVLSDIDVTPTNELESPETGGSAGMAFGREGNIVLVNGRQKPRVTIPPGVTQRWRIVNAAKSRYFDLDAGEQHRLLQIGGDGGFLEQSVDLPTVRLAPGERADVIITPAGPPGTEIPVIARLFDRGYGSTEARMEEGIFSLVMGSEPAPPPVPLPRVTRAIEPLSLEGAEPVAIEFNVAQDTVSKAFYYTINGQSLGKFKPVQATVGTTQIWTITNPSPWSHPFHLHGFFFQVLDENNQPVRPLQWKDTVDVPYKKSVRVAVKYDDRPGLWMFHCHILDHADGGLMAFLSLARPGEAHPAPPPIEHAH